MPQKLDHVDNAAGSLDIPNDYLTIPQETPSMAAAATVDHASAPVVTGAEGEWTSATGSTAGAVAFGSLS